MGKKIIVDCDYCGKDLKPGNATDVLGDQFYMSQVMIAYKSIGVMDKLNEDTGKKEKTKYILKPSTYDLQFCDDCSPKFMDHMRKFFANAPCADKRELK